MPFVFNSTWLPTPTGGCYLSWLPGKTIYVYKGLSGFSIRFEERGQTFKRVFPYEYLDEAKRRATEIASEIWGPQHPSQ